MKFLLYYLLIINIVTFLVYFIDKRKAIKGRWRIPEKHMHLLELLGGTPFAFLAHRFLRHKNRKVSYQVVFYLIVTLQISLWYFWVTYTEQKV